MINTLTPEQEALLPVYRDRWLGIGLSTEVMDFERAKAALARCYTAVGLTPPTNVHYAKGPNDAFKIFKGIHPKGGPSDFLNNCIYGAHDAYWLSFFSYFQEVCNFDLSMINGLVAYAKEGGWAWVDAHDAIIQERPQFIKMDEENRLHCEDGPAIQYLDGTQVYAWHGNRLDRSRWHWIDNKSTLTAKEALKQNNLEMRRIACEILGWVHILDELGATVIDADEDPMIGTLVEVDIPDVGVERFVKVVCGTGREFALPVPPDMKTALAANAWTFGIEPDMLRDLDFRT
jgi:hypothetical protein